EHHSMHQVVYRLADKQAGGEFGTEELVAIGRRAIGRGDMVGGAGVVKPCQRTADGKQPGVGLKCRSRIGWGEIRVAAEVAIGEDIVPAPIRVVVAEPMAPVVAVATV